MIPGLFLDEEAFVLGDIPLGGDVEEYERFVRRNHIADTWILQLEYRERGVADETDAEMDILGDINLGFMPPGGVNSPPLQEELFSSNLWVARPDEPGPRNRSAYCRLTEPLSVTVTAPITPDTANRSLQVNANSILKNDQGELDWLASGTTIDGLNATIRNGRRRGYWNDFAIRFRGLGQAARGGSGEVRIDYDLSTKAARTAVTSSVYDGRGGFGGDPQLAGVVRDLALGEPFNISPRLVSIPHQVYQFSTGRSQAVTGVYEAMIPLIPTQDYPDFNSLIEADIPPGHYATCLAHSAFRLSAVPVGTITCSVRGFVTPAGNYLSTVSQWINYMLLSRLGLALSEIDNGAIGFLPPYACGWHTGGDVVTVQQLFDDICASVNGFHGINRFGRYTVKRVFAPETYVSAPPLRIPGLTLQEEQLDEFVRSEQAVLVRQNWTILSQDQVSDLAPADLAARAQQEGETYTAPNGRAVAEYPTSEPGAVIRSVFTTQAGAQVGTDVIDLLGIERDTFRGEVSRMTGLDVGDPVFIEADRYGVGGRIMIVREIIERARDRKTQLKLFGAAVPAERDRLLSRADPMALAA